MFNIVAAAVVDERTLQEVYGDDADKRGIITGTPRPVSAIINPNGELIGGPLEGEEGIVTAGVDVGESIEWKQVHDITGGYNRFDIFQLRVNTMPLRPLQLEYGLEAVSDYPDALPGLEPLDPGRRASPLQPGGQPSLDPGQ